MTADEPALGSRQRHYTDPMGRRLPELERCMIRHRALQMVLIIYHAEELKREIIKGVALQESWRKLDGIECADSSDEMLKDNKKLRRAFAFLVKDGVLTPDEKKQIVALIDRRNGIAHHLDEVTADLSTDRFVREMLPLLPARKTHDYETLDQLRSARCLLSDRMIAKHYAGEISFRSLFSDATERALEADLKALDRRIRKLVRKRRDEIAFLNAEMSLDGTGLIGVLDPRWPDNRDDRGCLTPKGVETCYRLFDVGKSVMAVAHIMGFTLASARRRKQMWTTLGGANRHKRAFTDMPKM